MRRDPNSSGFRESAKNSISSTDDTRKLKRRLREQENEIATLQERLDFLSSYHQASVELSVDFLYDLEYHKYKSSFIDIDISFQPGNPKTLMRYGNNMKQFFMESLGCTYLHIHCSGISRMTSDLLKLKHSRKPANMAEYCADRTRVYYVDLQDTDLPERKIGRIVLGRYVYRDTKKEEVFHKKIQMEVQLSKRLLENAVSVIQNKELAVKDALTGLSTRKIFEERLYEEFASIDLFPKLNVAENSLAQIIINADGQPGRVIRGLFFKERNINDEVLFDKTVNKLVDLGMISISHERHLGELDEFYYFKTSKKKINVCVAMFDLDYFKDVNDNWGGHEIGDHVLKKFADILKRNIRTSDIPIRYGGEEFIALFTRVDSPEKIVHTLERIRRECEKQLVVEKDGKKRNITVSIGLTRISRYDRNIEQIIRRVDAALYRAKNQRNRIIFYEQERSEFVRVV